MILQLCDSGDGSIPRIPLSQLSTMIPPPSSTTTSINTTTTNTKTRTKTVEGIILLPTRELAIQVQSSLTLIRTAIFRAVATTTITTPNHHPNVYVTTTMTNHNRKIRINQYNRKRIWNTIQIPVGEPHMMDSITMKQHYRVDHRRRSLFHGFHLTWYKHYMSVSSTKRWKSYYIHWTLYFQSLPKWRPI